MMDMTERPEDTIRRFAGIIQELTTWQSRYREAAELWESLELGDQDHITEAVLVAKIADVTEGGTAISMSASDECDWVTQFGMLSAALNIMRIKSSG